MCSYGRKLVRYSYLLKKYRYLPSLRVYHRAAPIAALLRRKKERKTAPEEIDIA